MSKLLSPPENGYAIVGDIHGRADLLLRATELIDPATTRFVVQDMLDKGPEVRRTLQVAQEIGSIALADNHGWVCANALSYPEHGERLWLDGWYRRYEDATLESFGIARSGYAARDAQRLRERLEDNGLLSLVFEATPYLEPADDSFIAIHGGLLPGLPWPIQKQSLDATTQPSQRWQHAPEQIFDDGHKLSMSTVVPVMVTTKRLITGHSHFSATAEQRITNHGQRIRLGSRLGRGEPLFIYLTKSQEIITIEQ